MLSCPLATHFETLWLTTDTTNYARRFSAGVFASIILHLALISGIWYYQFREPILSDEISAGSPNLPLRVELVTAQTLQKAAEQFVEKPIQKKETVKTISPSSEKIARTEKSAPQTKPQPEKIISNDKNTSMASSPKASTTEGVTTLNLSELRWRISPVIPQYPEQAKRRNQQGTVVLLLTVETTGHISNASIARSSGYTLLDQSAQKAARQWELYPFTSNGTPIRRTISVPYQFSLSKG